MPPRDSNGRFPVRKNPRLRNYDYAKPNYYFVTICTHDKRCIFGNAGNLNRSGEIAKQGIENIPEHFPGARVDKYAVMPNHVHMILALELGKASLSDIVGQYKSYVTRQIHACVPDLSVWQTSFHDHIIRSQKSYETIWLYIDANPRNWENDCFYEKNAGFR